MNALAIESTDAQWEAYYAAVAAQYRAQAAVCRAEARAELAKPFGTPDRSRVAELLARAGRYEQMARENEQGELE